VPRKDRPSIRLEAVQTTYAIWVARDGIDEDRGTIKVCGEMGVIEIGKKTDLTAEELAEVLRQLPKVEET